MHPVLKALSAQIGGWGIALLLCRSGLIAADLWPIVVAQTISAVSIAALLRSARWWLPIHLAFTPLLAVTHNLSLNPNWYLAVFFILIVFYWSSFRTQVPLFLSSRATASAIAALLPPDKSIRLLDIGSGTGSLLIPLAVSRPDCRFSGIECAPAPWLLSRWRSLRIPNLELMRGDFFSTSWADYDIVYAFLSPVPMPAVWRKAQAEMRPGALLISNSFPVPGVTAAQVIHVTDRCGTQLYLYRPSQTLAAE